MTKHYKIFDGGGLIQAVLVHNADNVNIVKPDATVEIVGTIDDVKSKIGGDYVEIPAEEYEAIYSTWKEKADANAAKTSTAEDPAKANDPGAGGADAGSQGSAAANGNGNGEPAKTDGSDVSGNPGDASQGQVNAGNAADASSAGQATSSQTTDGEKSGSDEGTKTDAGA